MLKIRFRTLLALLALLLSISLQAEHTEKDQALAEKYAKLAFDPSGKKASEVTRDYSLYEDPVLGKILHYQGQGMIIRTPDGGEIIHNFRNQVKLVRLPDGKQCLYFISLNRYQWPLMVADRAPDYSLKIIGDENTRETLAAHRGKVVLIVFWTEWCRYCPRSLAQAQSLHEKYRDKGLVVRGINVEKSNTAGGGQASEAISRLKITFPCFVGERDPQAPPFQIREAWLYTVQGIPATFLIDKKGVLRFRGVSLQDEVLLNRLLDEKI